MLFYLPKNSLLPKLLVVVVASLAALTSTAQKNDVYDSAYYQTYPRQVVGRLFFSQKYTNLTADAPGSKFRYSPNNPFALGVGATYGIATLNIGIGLPFFTDKDLKGKTKTLDLQSHIYARKWVVDLYGQFYKGYYLNPRGKAALPNDYYIRPDMKVQLIGASAYHIFNSSRFSYRAGFLQNEWQKKSAGSFLLGGEIYAGKIQSDSALGPSTIDNQFSTLGISRVSFVEFGPGAGYAHTFVYRQNWFLTASATVNADISFNKEKVSAGKEKQTAINPNFTLRGVAGYNSDTWSATVSWVENNLNTNGSNQREYLVRTGNFRVTVAKRFRPGRQLKKKLEVIDELPVQP
ncbi:MAG: DUF4421 domain-containing protein [Chitinophagaceae bacterium]|nr:MAG: DUF4421 domain-containing protein [Chitinophagaceae bacterium]